jgi:hypothetical protein
MRPTIFRSVGAASCVVVGVGGAGAALGQERAIQATVSVEQCLQATARALGADGEFNVYVDAASGDLMLVNFEYWEIGRPGVDNGDGN